MRPALRNAGRKPLQEDHPQGLIHNFPALWDGFPVQLGWSCDLLCEMQVAAVSWFIILGLRPVLRKASPSNREALSIRPRRGQWQVVWDPGDIYLE